MKFQVIKVEQAVVNKPGSNNHGQVYANITLECPTSGESRIVPVFDLESKQYLPFIGKEGELPENLKSGKWAYCFDEQYVFPGNQPMVRVNANGQPETNKFGIMYQRTEVTVMVRCHRDDDYAMLHPDKYPSGICIVPDKGWDVISRGTSVMNAFYVPLSSVVPAAGPSTADNAPAPANIPV